MRVSVNESIILADKYAAMHVIRIYSTAGGQLNTDLNTVLAANCQIHPASGRDCNCLKRENKYLRLTIYGFVYI